MLKQIEFDKIKKGDPEAFQKFFQLLYPKLVTHACRFVNEQTAKDLVQDLFVLYWEQKHKLEIENILAFLYKCLHNSCLNHLKHQKIVGNHEIIIRLAKEKAATMDHLLENNPTLETIEAQNLREIIESFIEKLPPRCAEAFRLRYFNDMSHKEIAKKMDISQRTAENHTTQAIKSLRQKLKKIRVFFFMF